MPDPFPVAILAGGLAVAVRRIVIFCQSVVAPIKEFVSEHNVLWEDYNIRTGGRYRRSTGRGDPPDPEEYYRTHHAAVADVSADD